MSVVYVHPRYCYHGSFLVRAEKGRRWAPRNSVLQSPVYLLVKMKMESKHGNERGTTSQVPLKFKDRTQFFDETGVKIFSPDPAKIAEVIRCLSETFTCNVTSQIMFNPDEKRFFQYVSIT